MHPDDEAPRPLRVGIWCAVSGRAQAADDKDSLPDQERRGRAWAEQVGAEVVGVYVVPGHSRDYVFWQEAEEAMPAYAEARQAIEGHRLDVLFVLDADRLGRDPALIQQFYSLAERHGVEIYDADMPHNLGQQSMGHRYGVAVKSVSVGEDQRKRLYRHAMGMRARVKRGLHSGTLPYGYRAIRDAAGRTVGAEFDGNVGAVRLATERYLAGWSYQEIADALEASAWRPPRAEHWSRRGVRHLLARDTYAGIVSFRELHVRSELIPRVWDEATYGAMLRERERRRVAGLQRHPESGPLRGVVFCGWCNSPMYRSKDRGGARYLRCTKREACRGNHVKESLLLSEVGKYLDSLTTPEAVAQAVSQANAPTNDLGDEAAGLDELLAELEAERRRLGVALARGQMRSDIYYSLDSDLVERREQAQARREQIEQAMSQAVAPEERAEMVLQAARSFQRLLSERDPALVSTTLQRIGLRVTVVRHSRGWDDVTLTLEIAN